MKSIRKLPLLAAALALTLALETGAAAAPSTADSQTTAVDQAAKSTAFANAVYNKAETLLKKKDGLAYAKSYITKNIHHLTKSQATRIVLKLENAVNAGIAGNTDKLLKERYQLSLRTTFKQGSSITTVLNRTKDTQLRALLADLKDSGYKLRALEGSVYPIVDYNSFKPYQPYVNKDIQRYIDMMSTESSNPSVGDAALLISWSEVIERALVQESFIRSFPVSNRSRSVASMYDASLAYLFYGMPNTPLFSYDTKKLDPDARTAFDKLLAKKGLSNNSLRQKLKAWSDVLKQNGDKLTAQVDKHRRASVPNKIW
ncbi:hypothetical protein [Paenibacillus dakarensis]|uniref:hypothetical protein n=1 Tax=Paenibacillus dakarensis TaxID=1527293 RepID=UPI0006D59CD7|nr:hypothetical protein [Paenibacillus dakarensis]